MQSAASRRSFLQFGLTAAAASLLPRWALAQAHGSGQYDPATLPVKPTKLADNLYLLQGAGGNMALQFGPDGLLLIDSSFAPAVPRIREAIAALVPAPPAAPSLLVNTHWHGDHTGGNEGMHAAGYTILAHRQTRQRLSTTQTMKLFNRTIPPSPAGALPTQVFDETFTLFRNGDTVDMVHYAPAHTDTDITLTFGSANVVHMGDLWFNGIYPVIDESTGGNIHGMIAASAKALTLVDANTKIIPGHGPLGDKAQLQAFHDMLSGVRDKVAALKQAGLSEQEAVAKKPTADFDSKWGQGIVNADVLTGIVYRTL